jgi:hypothetical protein
MSVEETAELFGILPQTVKTRLHRGRALLKREMEKHIGPVLGHAFPAPPLLILGNLLAAAPSNGQSRPI